MIDKIQWLIEKLENKKHEKEMLYAELDAELSWFIDFSSEVMLPSAWASKSKHKGKLPFGTSRVRVIKWKDVNVTDDEWIDEMYEEAIEDYEKAIEDYGESLCSQSKED